MLRFVDNRNHCVHISKDNMASCHQSAHSSKQQNRLSPIRSCIVNVSPSKTIVSSSIISPFNPTPIRKPEHAVTVKDIITTINAKCNRFISKKYFYQTSTMYLFTNVVFPKNCLLQIPFIPYFQNLSL